MDAWRALLERAIVRLDLAGVGDAAWMLGGWTMLILRYLHRVSRARACAAGSRCVLRSTTNTNSHPRACSSLLMPLGFFRVGIHPHEHVTDPRQLKTAIHAEADD